MSYILDALRRADAERERGNVPGLHTQRAAATAAGAAPPAWRAAVLGLGAGGAVAVLALLVWQQWPTRAAASATVPPAPAPIVAATVPPARVEPTVPVTVSAGSASTEAVVRSPAPPAVATPRKRIAPPVAPLEVARVAGAASAPVAPAVPPRGGAAASAPPAPAVSTLAELPEDIRRQLPALTVGGSAYSTSPASRFVIVNGQLFREGDALAPGLVLEQIRLKSAVLAFKGYRYGIAF